MTRETWQLVGMHYVRLAPQVRADLLFGLVDEPEPQTMDELERSHVIRAIQTTDSITEAARVLGRSRRYMHVKINEYGLKT